MLCAKVAQGCTLEDAAAAAGMSVSTAQRRLREPELQARLDALRRELTAEANGRLVALQAKAVSTLDELVECGPAPVRLRAAIAVLEFGARLGADAARDARIAELEASIPALLALEEKLRATEGEEGAAA